MIKNKEHIDKVLKILSKTLSKKYPYLSNIQLSGINDEVGVIYIDINLDLNEFIEYHNLNLSPLLSNLILKYSYDKDYIDNLISNIGYLNTWVDVDDNDDRFGYKKNDEIETYLQGMTDMLPSHLIPTHEFHSVLTDTTTDYPINFRVKNYIPAFNFERYLNYINQ